MSKLSDQDQDYVGDMSMDPFMPLEMVEGGQRVSLVSVDAGHKLKARLAAMGLVPGAEIEVIRNLRSGPFVIMIKGSRIILGGGKSLKIVVK